jgi:hypothetical protein
MQNNIHTKDGLHAELKSIMANFRTEFDNHVLHSAHKLSITQLQKVEHDLFNRFKDLVFDVVHASCALQDTEEVP